MLMIRLVAGPWRITRRWLTDSSVYNEWMNEVDYEPEDAAADTADEPASARLLPDTLSLSLSLCLSLSSSLASQRPVITACIDMPPQQLHATFQHLTRSASIMSEPISEVCSILY